MKNRAKVINDVFVDCLYRDDELTGTTPPEGAVIVDAIMNKFGFHPGRLLEHDAEIREALNGLPEQFYADKGGGWTFLNLCNDASGHQWGEHINMEQLCALAIARGYGRWLLPREMWSVLPGGMPYVQFNRPDAVIVAE